MLKLEPGNEAVTDGQTDGHSNAFFCGGYDIIPRTFSNDHKDVFLDANVKNVINVTVIYVTLLTFKMPI